MPVPQFRSRGPTYSNFGSGISSLNILVSNAFCFSFHSINFVRFLLVRKKKETKLNEETHFPFQLEQIFFCSLFHMFVLFPFNYWISACKLSDCVYVGTCLYIDIYICICICICMYVWTYLYIDVYIYLYMYMYICMDIFIHIHIHIYIYVSLISICNLYVYIHIYIYEHIWAH